jgi:hypothetical protein
MADEPEAVSEHEQEQQTRIAHRRDRERRVAAFVEARAMIDAALDAFTASLGGSPARELVAGVQTVRRSADRLGRRL